MNLKERLQQEMKINQVKWEVIEQDYVLSWILEGISRVPDLKNNLVFKGGTALKKIYFGDYRFSQDLDFSVIKNPPKFDNLDELMKKACKFSSDALNQTGENIEFKSEPYIEKRPHPEGQKAYVISARLPWHRDFYTTVYVEMSFQEIILMNPKERKIIHPYGDSVEGGVYVYPLEEILAEKIRALIQFSKKLHERGWGRSRVRDYYDLWRILKAYRHELNLEILPELVNKKCTHKGVVFETIEDIFQENLMLNLEREWEAWLLDMVKILPPKEIIIQDLREILGSIFITRL